MLNAMMMRRAVLQLAVLAVACSQSNVHAATILGSNVDGLLKYFQLNNGNSSFTGGDIAFDPTTSGRIYITDYVSNDTRRGIWRVNMFGTEIPGYTSAAPIAIVWDQVARFTGGGSVDYPAGVIVDSSGDLRVAYDRTASIWKVENPLAVSPTEVETQMLSQYSSSGDDDFISLAFVPTGFGGSYDAGSDVIVFDQGHGVNENLSIAVVKDASETGVAELYTEIASISNVLGDGSNVDWRGDASSKDGYAYFMGFTHDVSGRGPMLTDTVGVDTLPYINRVNSSGVIERVFLDSTTMTARISDAMKINPADGSAWFGVENSGREIWRADLMNATSLGGGDFLASVSLEIDSDSTDAGFSDIGQNGLAFSPNGEYLAVMDPTGRERLFIYNLAAVPEPSSVMLFALTAFAGTIRMRRA